MKEKVFLIMMLVMAVMPCTSKTVESIRLVQITNPFPDLGREHRSICVPIYVSQEDHRFVFNASLAGETIQILAGDTLLYTDVIGADGSVNVPEDITGEVELRLVRGSLTYHAMVEL